MNPLQITLDQFHSPQVIDLAWAILSPPLMVANPPHHNFSTTFYQQAFTDFLPYLQQLNANPAPLCDFLNQRKDKRLGPYFEQLWLYWLKHNGRFQCLANNVQIHDDTRTLGELDLIVKDTQTNEIEHWELAIKFYLGIEPLTEGTNWFGPTLNDRLDKKFIQLNTKQLTFVQTPNAQAFCEEQHWVVSRSRLISKGCLFMPHHAKPCEPACINSNHVQGTWSSINEFVHYWNQKPATIKVLEKRHWLNQLGETELPVNGLSGYLSANAVRLPVQVSVEFEGKRYRHFLVTEDWEQRARISL